jgi:hypothetical protein
MNVQPDYSASQTQAKTFLELLAQGPIDSLPFLFVAIAESAVTRAKANANVRGWQLVCVLHDLLSRALGYLRTWNGNGYGIFVLVNRTTRHLSRTTRDIDAVRAQFVDWDRKTNPVPPNLSACQPAFSVETRGGAHHYWHMASSAKGDLADWVLTQRHLAAALGTDPAVCDLPRVMRLPGFYHLKQEPFFVHLIHPTVSGQIAHGVSGADLRAHFPLPKGHAIPPPRPAPIHSVNHSGLVDIQLPHYLGMDLSVLDKVQRKSHACEWICLCPVHEVDGRPHTPSLDVALTSGGKVLYHCWAGCEFGDIRAAIDKRLIEALPEPPMSAHLKAILELLGQHERTPTGWRTDCPVCNKDMGLNVRLSRTDTISYFCRSKCSHLDIRRAVATLVKDALGDSDAHAEEYVT